MSKEKKGKNHRKKKIHSVLVGLCGRLDIMVCLDDMAGMDLLDFLVFMEFMDTGAAYNLRTFSLREHVY